MNLTIPFRAAVAFCLAGCAGVVPQFSDYVYSADLASSDPNTAEVRVTHGLDENDVAEVVWIGRAAYPVAQEHCGSMGKTAGRAQTRNAGSGVMVFTFPCVAPKASDPES